MFMVLPAAIDCMRESMLLKPLPTVSADNLVVSDTVVIRANILSMDKPADSANEDTLWSATASSSELVAASKSKVVSLSTTSAASDASSLKPLRMAVSACVASPASIAPTVESLIELSISFPVSSAVLPCLPFIICSYHNSTKCQLCLYNKVSILTFLCKSGLYLECISTPSPISI